MIQRISKIIRSWKGEFVGALFLMLLVFEIFFYKDGFKPLILTIMCFVFILLPGVLFASYIFGSKLKRYERIIVGFGFGLILTPSLIYFINIFEVLHAKYLGFIIPIVLILLFGWLNMKNVDKVA